MESNDEGLLGGMEVAGFPQNFHVGSYLRIGTFNVSAIVNLPLWRVAQEDNSTFIMVTDTRSILGQGQFGVCFAGEYQGRSVATKITKKKLDADLFKEFLREVKLMAFQAESIGK